MVQVQLIKLSNNIITFKISLMITFLLLLLCYHVSSKSIFIEERILNEWSRKPFNPTHDDNVQFRLALQPNNEDELQILVKSISDPKSENFHQYMSNDDLASLLQPPRNDLDALYHWVNSNMYFSHVHFTFIDILCIFFL